MGIGEEDFKEGVAVKEMGRVVAGIVEDGGVKVSLSPFFRLARRK